VEIIPVIYTYWRYEQLLWDRLGEIADPALPRLRALATVHGIAWALLVTASVTRIYVAIAWPTMHLILAAPSIAVAMTAALYAISRSPAKHRIWPDQASASKGTES
jgi:hypothetical protein